MLSNVKQYWTVLNNVEQCKTLWYNIKNVTNVKQCNGNIVKQC